MQNAKAPVPANESIIFGIWPASSRTWNEAWKISPTAQSKSFITLSIVFFKEHKNTYFYEMILKLFRHTQAFSIISILIASLIVWIGLYNSIINEETIRTNPIFSIGNLGSGIVIKILTALFIFWTCNLFNNIVIEQKVLSNNTYFPALFYFLIISSNTASIALSPTLIASFFMLVFVKKTLNSYSQINAQSSIFESAFYISIASIIHPPIIIFYPMVWISLSIFSHMKMKNWLLSILGLISPWFIIITIGMYFEFDHLYINHFYYIINNTASYVDMIWPERIVLIFMALIFVLSLFELIISFKRKNIRSRKSYILFIWLIVFSLLFTMVRGVFTNEILILLAAPFGAIISNYAYYHSNRNWLNIVIMVWLSLFIYQHTTY